MTLTDLRDAPGIGTRLDAFDAVDATAPYGAQLRQVREAAEVFRRDFLSTGQPTSVVTKDLVTLPYPTRFGLWRAALTPSPYLSITNRMLVIRWDDNGTTKTLVFEPSDYELRREHAVLRSGSTPRPRPRSRSASSPGTRPCWRTWPPWASRPRRSTTSPSTTSTPRTSGAGSARRPSSRPAHDRAGVPEREADRAARRAVGDGRPAPAAAALVPARDLPRPAPAGDRRGRRGRAARPRGRARRDPWAHLRQPVARAVHQRRHLGGQRGRHRRRVHGPRALQDPRRRQAARGPGGARSSSTPTRPRPWPTSTTRSSRRSRWSTGRSATPASRSSSRSSELTPSPYFPGTKPTFTHTSITHRSS